jgi:hypothetical protein
MRSSPTISLFSAQPELDRQPYSFLVSIVLHVAAVALLLFGIISAPKVKTPVIAARYEVRHLDLHTLDSELQQALASAPKPIAPSPKRSSPPAPGADAQQAALRQVVKAPPGPQTLVQPDIPKPVTLAVEIPVPTIVISNAADTPSKTIVAPVPQKPPVADVKPSLQKPNQEPNLAEIAIPAAAQPVLNQPILPSTTAPVVLEGPKPTPPAPISTAASAAQPTNATVISLSNTRMANGAVALPPVNESVATNSPGALAPGQAKDASHAGHGDASGKAAGKANGTEGGKSAAAAADSNGRPGDAQRAGNGDAQGAKSGSGQNASGLPGSSPASQSSARHIKLPRTGQFGSVVIGSSLAEKYPETAEQWGGRLSYTVYLHVGLPKSWILQYSLPRAGDSAEGGGNAHIEAPWPYEIVLPSLPPDAIDADALMIHGFVNLAGRFETLAVAFPPDFAQAQYVLGLLNQWQFRPATQNGQDVKVEILLIIPEEQE